MTINDSPHAAAGVDKFNEFRPSDMMDEPLAVCPKTMPVAIVGMSCRFPGDATDPDKLWDLRQSGRDAWSEIPEGRFDGDAWYHPDRDHVGTVRLLNPRVSIWNTRNLADTALLLPRIVLCERRLFPLGRYLQV